MAWMLVLVILAIFVAVGFISGYWLGRRRGMQEARQGFPVLPMASKDQP